MAPKRVLISGAGIAGPVLVYWLDKHGMKAIIIERAANLRNTIGRGRPSLQIIQKLGLEEKIGELGTHRRREQPWEPLQDKSTLPLQFLGGDSYQSRHITLTLVRQDLPLL